MRSYVKSSSMQRVIRWTILGLTLFSLIFAFIGLLGCQFFFVEDFGYGFYRAGAYDNENKLGCLRYTEAFNVTYLQVPSFRAGKLFALLTVLTITICFILLLWLYFFLSLDTKSSTTVVQNLIWKIIRINYIICLLTQLFTFSVFGMENCKAAGEFCKVGPGGALAAMNVWILIALIVLIFLVPPPNDPIFRTWNSNLNDYDDLNTSKEVNVLDTSDDHDPYAATSQSIEVIDLHDNDNNNHDDSHNIKSKDISNNTSNDTSRSSSYNSSTTTSSDDDHNPPSLFKNNKNNNNNNGDQVHVSTEYTKDGKKTIREVTHPDGSKTITTTLEAYDNDNEQEVLYDEVDV